MRGFRRYAGLILLLSGLALFVAACSGSGGTIDAGSSGSSSSSGGGSTTYTNDKYGFTLTHDNQFTQGEPVAGTGAGGSSVLDVVFADKNGAKVSNRYVDAVQVSVYQLSREIKPADVPKLKSELNTIVKQMMASLPTATIVDPLTPVVINDVPGFGLKYTYTEAGTDITAVTFFLIKGKTEFQITAQATSANWDALKAKLEAAAKSFTAK